MPNHTHCIQCRVPTDRLALSAPQVRSNAVDAVKTLLEANADVQAVCNGKTALEIATINNKPKMVELLTAAGASS